MENRYQATNDIELHSLIVESNMNLSPPPPDMCSGPVKLIFMEFKEVQPDTELVPFYYFNIATKDGAIVGHINFKVGNTNHIRVCAGHIGYWIAPEYRGNKYSYYACDAIRPFVRTLFDKVILTSDPDNFSSIKIIEKLNATFLNEIIVPEHDPSYIKGARRKKRYEWIP